jgi:hypothetical protein
MIVRDYPESLPLPLGEFPTRGWCEGECNRSLRPRIFGRIRKVHAGAVPIET